MDAELRERVARVWAFRARFEREAEAHFTALASALRETGAPAELTALCDKAAADEARHAKLAMTLAQRFGLDVQAPPQRSAPRVAPTHLEAPKAALYTSVALCAVMESLSAAILRDMRECAEDPQVKQTIHEIFRDEITHSRIGWGHLAWVARSEDVSWLAPHIPRMMAATVQEEIFEAPEGEHGAMLEPWGGLRRERRRMLFEEAMSGLVIPGLARMGIDTEASVQWLSQRAIPRHDTARA